jgi:putative alpha-1,2-mannosidase
MVGSHADIVMADLIMKREFNSSQFNVSLAMEACNLVANNVTVHDSRFDPDTYKKYGYVPYEDDDSGASTTLSYATDDWYVKNKIQNLKNKT